MWSPVGRAGEPGQRIARCVTAIIRRDAACRVGVVASRPLRTVPPAACGAGNPAARAKPAGTVRRPREVRHLQDARASEAATRPGPRPSGALERAGRGSWWALGIALLVILAFMGLARFGTFIIPSLIGIVLATTLSPVVGWLQRHHIPRLLAAAVISVFIVAGLVLLAWGIVSLVVNRSPHIWGMLKGLSLIH